MPGNGHLKLDFNARGAPGHPVKYLFHRSSFDHGPYYRNIVDWQFDKTKALYKKNLLAHFGCVNAIEFSRDGSLLVSGGDDRRILLWNVDKAVVSKEEPKVMQAEHLSNVFSLDFSCSSSKVISAGNDDQVIVHDNTTLAPLDYFVHEQPVYCISAHPENESIFCSACDDGRILIFDIRESGNDPFCLAKVSSAFHSTEFHPTEPRLVVTANSKEGVALWDVRMPKRVFVKYGLQNSNQCCMSARFNRMGSQILVLRRRLPPILYATESPVHLYQFNHRGYYNSCTMKSCSFAGQHDQYVLSGSDNFDLHLWKIPGPGGDQWVNKADMVLRGHRSIVNQVRYNYAHNVIASSGVEKIVKFWSPFPMPDEPGGRAPTIVTNESERRIYTPDDYVSLVMQAGQGHFMSLTYEAGRKTTREDSRMLAFFDALVQRDINGLSDEDSDNFPETSYTNTVYTTPETSSSDNEDEDSNPPNFRSHLPIEPNPTAFNRIGRNINRNEETNEIEDDINSNQASSNDNNILSNNNDNEGGSVEHSPSNEIQSSSEQAADDEVTNSDTFQDELNEQTEDRDMTANMITQLILEKENNRRKLLPKSNSKSSVGRHSTNQGDNNSDLSSEDTSTDDDDPVTRPPPTLISATSLGKKASGSRSSKSYSKNRKEFKKQLLRIRRREVMSTPVYDSSRNTTETATSTSTSFERISELMTRHQSTQSESSMGSSTSSSSSDSSSSEDCELEKNKLSVIKEAKRKVGNSRNGNTASSSDSSSSSDSELSNGSDENSGDEGTKKPTTSSCPLNLTVRDVKWKRRPPCKLNEACKAFFKRYMDSDSESRQENGETDTPPKRLRLDLSESPTTTSSPSTDPNAIEVERFTFKKSNRSKDRNYRKASTGVCSTPPDSGIDVSKEPEPCCSKAFSSIQTSDVSDALVSSVKRRSVKKLSPNRKKEPFDDAGFEQADSGGESD